MSVSAQEVEESLARGGNEARDLLRLLSPAAAPYLETMAQRAHALTQQRFGRVMKLYAPLYISNECTNSCVYCGFNRKQKSARRTLSLEEVWQQAGYLAQQGFRNILLVSGESRQHVPVEYLAACIRRLKPLFPEISIEVYPLETEEYRLLHQAGLFGLTVYQETYIPADYARFHPAGRKRCYAYRLDTPERGAQAGLRQVGLGVLIGLADFRVDAFYLGMHMRYLEKKYWRTVFGLSFPRLRQAGLAFQPPRPVNDRELVQMVVALRFFLPDAPFALSTREPEALRTNLLPLGFTLMSAGSRTTPGGYGLAKPGLAQFHVEDERPVPMIAAELIQHGFEVVWKDWDADFDHCVSPRARGGG